MRRRLRCIFMSVLSMTTFLYLALRHSQNSNHSKSPEVAFAEINSPLRRHLDSIPVQTFPRHSGGYYVGLGNSDFREIVNPNGNKPTILIWRAPFGTSPTYLANPEVCGGDVDCVVTYDRDLLSQSGAVVFHFGSVNMDDMPSERRPEQLYAWWTGEKNHEGELKEYDNFFNLTFTYRSDSGIYAPYGSTNLILRELREAKELSIEDLLRKKRSSGKIAAWAVSNCGVRKRMDLANQIMQAGLKVDTFGGCFGGRQIGQGRYSSSFYQALSEYKFYFAFENGYHCKDYITEKFWFNGLRSGAVPIVWGPTKKDLEAVAPTNSFIHVEDFATVEDLVGYLQYLSKNETAYRKHLAWRTWVAHPELMEERLKPANRDNDLRSFCKLCRILQEEEDAARNGRSRRRMVVPSMNEFWWKKENHECIRG